MARGALELAPREGDRGGRAVFSLWSPHMLCLDSLDSVFSFPPMGVRK